MSIIVGYVMKCIFIIYIFEAIDINTLFSINLVKLYIVSLRTRIIYISGYREYYIYVHLILISDITSSGGMFHKPL